MKWSRRSAIEIAERAAAPEPEPVTVPRETAWETLLCEVFDGAACDAEGRIDLQDVASRLRAGLAADRVVLLEMPASGAMRVLAAAGMSGEGIPATLHGLVNEANTKAFATSEGGMAAAAGVEPRIVLGAEGLGFCGLTEVEQRSALRCLVAWLATEIRGLRRLERCTDAAQEHKYQSLSHFAVRAGHEFRNSLAAILTQTEFVLDRVDENHIAHQNLEDVVLAAREAANKVDALMVFGGLLDRAPPEPIDLHQQLQGVTSVLRALVPESIRLEVRVEPESSAGIQPVHLRQMLVNLVANAAEAMGKSAGTIQIDIAPADGDSVEMLVIDDGPGMEPRTLQRAMDPFFTTRKGNRGLGLPVALGIARGCGGSLSIRSEPGSGSCVSVILPKHARPPGRIV